jgi:hypothetical protein
MREFTHRDPDLVFWIAPDGRLHDARRSHRENPPKGFEHIVDDEPDYGGFLRGRVARAEDHQLVVVYCRPGALTDPGPAVEQLLKGLDAAPVPIDEDALVVSDNADIYGTVAYPPAPLQDRQHPSGASSLSSHGSWKLAA